MAKLPAVPQRKTIASGKSFGGVSQTSVKTFADGGKLGYSAHRDTSYNNSGGRQRGFKKGSRSSF